MSRDERRSEGVAYALHAYRHIRLLCSMCTVSDGGVSGSLPWPIKYHPEAGISEFLSRTCVGKVGVKKSENAAAFKSKFWEECFVPFSH